MVTKKLKLPLLLFCKVHFAQIKCTRTNDFCCKLSSAKVMLKRGNKMPTRCNRCFLLQILLLAQHVSGTNMPIIRSSIVLYGWLLPVVFGALVFKLSVWSGAEGCVSGLRAAALKQQPAIELLMMGIMVPEAC